MLIAMASPSKSRVERPTANPLNERLIEATLQLLREGIQTDLTVRGIATAAGTTTMALYTGFGSRDGLLDVVYARGFEQLRARMAPAAQVGDASEAVLGLLEAYRAFALANPGLYGLLFERVLPGFDPSAEVRSTALDTTFGLLTSQAGRLLGTDAQNEASRRLAYTLWALTHGLVSLELSHASRTPLAHPALAETDGQDVLDSALRAALAGWGQRADRPGDPVPNR
jgi:AcrR family transcriptional regulator